MNNFVIFYCAVPQYTSKSVLFTIWFSDVKKYPRKITINNAKVSAANRRAHVVEVPPASQNRLW